MEIVETEPNINRQLRIGLVIRNSAGAIVVVLKFIVEDDDSF